MLCVEKLRLRVRALGLCEVSNAKERLCSSI